MRTQDELDEYVTGLIEDRRSRPADDLLTALIAAEEDGDRLSPSELVSMVEAVIVGGTDTTRNQLGCTVALFASHPDQWALLAEQPELAARAVEESMRYLGAIRGTARYASEDIEYRDVVFPAGTFVFPSFTGANYDPGAFADPHEFDIRKPAPAAPQLTFGSGIHYCLGASLARAELQEALAHPGPPDARPGPGRRHHVEAGDLRHLGAAAPAPPLHPVLNLPPRPDGVRPPARRCGPGDQDVRDGSGRTVVSPVSRGRPGGGTALLTMRMASAWPRARDCSR